MTRAGPEGSVTAIPLALDFCRTRLASDEETAWITHRLRNACARFGTEVHIDQDRLVIDWP